MENKDKMKSMLKQMQSVIALVIIFVVASVICVKDGKNNFLDIRNLMNVLRAVSENGIIAIGMTIILILGDIDLSVGSVVGLISTGCAYLMVKSGLGFVPAVLLSLVIGGLFGLFNGLCITKMKLQAFIVTLASMNIARGLARFWANGIGIPLAYGEGEGMAPPAFEVLQMRIGGVIPVPAIIFLVLLIIFHVILTKFLLLSGCRLNIRDCADGYKYLVGVSLTNVMEPWLNNLAQSMEEKARQGKDINFIFRDAAGSTEKQIKDIRALMDFGVDLLIVSPDGSNSLNGILKEVYEKIPVVVVGVEPDTDDYTTLIQADDEGIGRMAGEYILNKLYKKGKKIVVLEGVSNSPISDMRLKGFCDAVKNEIPESQITYYYGDWLRDVAESRMKDYLVVNGAPDIVFAFNDEMAYGAYLACEQLRMNGNTKFIGVDGFEGETAGLNLIERSILEGTIQSPDFVDYAYDMTMNILYGKEVQRDVKIIPQFVGCPEKKK